MLIKFFSSIKGKMVTIYMGVIIVALLATCILVSNIMEEFMVSQRTESQTRDTQGLALEIAPLVVDGDATALFDFVTTNAKALDGRILFMDKDAVVQVDSASRKNGYRLPYREVRDVLIGTKDSSYGFHLLSRSEENSGLLSMNEKSVWAVYYTSPVTVEGVHVGVVLYSALIQDVVNSIQDVIRQIIAFFVIIAIVTGGVSLILAGWLTKPINELTSVIRNMGKNGYSTRVNLKGRGEIAELGSAFNRMSMRIEDHDRVRDEFIANASHELKTPLSTMKLLSETIIYQDEPDPGLMKEFFVDVNHEVDRLSNIITELLRLVQDDATQPELKYERFRLDELVSVVVARLKPLADKKNIEIRLNTVPLEIEASQLRIEQVAVNLIENAIKYTDVGSVDIQVTQDETNGILRVKDTGIGIPEEAQPHLFERFYRVDKARSRGTGGTGLGLSIVENIVRLHGGDIDIKSEVGKGSTFTVRIPKRKPQEAEQ